MKKELRGFSRIFSFTFKQHVKSKGYKSSTIMIGLLCLLLPAIIMIAVESLSGNDPAPVTGSQQEQAAAADLSQISHIYTVDLSDDRLADFSGLPAMISQGAGLEMDVTDYGRDLDEAAKAAAGTDDTLLIVTKQQGREYTMNIVIPQDSGISLETAQGFDSVLMAYADMQSVANGGTASYYGSEEAEGGGDSQDSMEMMISIFLSFIIVMVLYFFVLAYGQGVANSVVMEKSSKLMESFLISVRPAAIVLGKLLAITMTGIVQMMSWIIALVISFAVGTMTVRSMDPDSDMFILKLFDMVGELTSGLFTPTNCIMALLIVMAGMLLYCALAAIGGAMASKAEDLSSANLIFTLVLIASFLASLYGNEAFGGSGSELLDWIPFTSVMVAPAKILVGSFPLWKSVCCLGIILITTLIASLAAGKIYQSLALYRGDVLSPKKLIGMLRR